MKLSILFSLLFSTSLVWAAPKTLASCTVQFGPDQEIKVQQNDDGSLTLLEYHDGKLTPEKRILSASEWSKKQITLRTNDTVLLLSGDNKKGYLKPLPGNTFGESGPADCR